MTWGLHSRPRGIPWMSTGPLVTLVRLLSVTRERPWTLEVEDGQETVVDLEVEHEIEAVVTGLEPSEESDAVEVLATWRSTRTSMTQENSTRGCLRPAGVVKLGSPAEAHKNALRQDLARLSGRTSCYKCWEVGLFSRRCPKKRTPRCHSRAGVLAFDHLQ